VPVTGPVLLVLAVLGAVLFPAFSYLRPVLVNAQAALQFLGAALLPGSRMTLALLLAQRFGLLPQGIVPRAGRLVRASHGALPPEVAQQAVGPPQIVRPHRARAGRAAVPAGRGSLDDRPAGHSACSAPAADAVHQLADAQSTQIWAPLIVIGIEPTVAHIRRCVCRRLAVRASTP